MAQQLKLFSNTLLPRTSKCSTSNGITRKLSSLLKKYDVFDCKHHKNIKKPWQNALLLLTNTLPEQIAKRGAKKIQQGYHVRPITSKDREPTLDFLKRFFFRDEPVALAAKLLDGPDSRCIELEEYTVSTMEQGASLAAVADNGEFVGVVINAILRRSDVVDERKIDEYQNPNFKRVIRLLTHLSKESRLWEKVPASCNVVMDLKMASTHPEWRGKRIMQVLAKESERVAKEFGACGIRMDATSIFSARAAERLEYKNIYTVKYADIPDAPQPKKPHLQASVYLKTF